MKILLLENRNDAQADYIASLDTEDDFFRPPGIYPVEGWSHPDKSEQQLVGELIEVIHRNKSILYAVAEGGEDVHKVSIVSKLIGPGKNGIALVINKGAPTAL